MTADGTTAEGTTHPGDPVRRVAVSDHRGRGGQGTGEDFVRSRHRRGYLVAGGPAGGRRPDDGRPPGAGRKTEHAAARALECAHPRARVRRPVLPAGTAGCHARRGGQAGAARSRDRLRQLRGPAALSGRAGGGGGQGRPAAADPRSRRAGKRLRCRRRGRGRPPFCRFCAFPGPQRDLVRAGAARGRQGQPLDRGRPARRIGGAGPRGDPPAGQRRGLLRVPHPVTGREPAGVDLLESPAHAVGRHRAAGGADRERDPGQGTAGQGQPAGVCARPGVA